MGHSHISLAPAKKCYALMWSYSMTCVHCNCCGRFTKSKLKIAKARLEYHKEQLKTEEGFNNWLKDDAPLYEMQQRNHKANLKSRSRSVKKAEKEVKRLSKARKRLKK